MQCRWLGVERVFLTENDDEPHLKEPLQDFVETGFVEYRLERREHAQMQVYQACIEEHAHEVNWLAFFDIDEFLLLRNKCARSSTSE